MTVNENYLLTRFPEDLFLISEQNRHEYHVNTIKGFNVMSRSSVVIGMLARNNYRELVYNIGRAKFLGSLFSSYHIVIYENDSNDGKTKDYIKSLKSVKITAISEDLHLEENKQDKSLGRRQRMSLYRNKCRKIMRHVENSDFYIILDSDVKGGFSYEGIGNSIYYLDSGCTDCMASNSIIYDECPQTGDTRRLYYDSWAYRDIDHPAEHKSDDINLRIFHRGEKPINVFSAFGGLAIYKNRAFNCNACYLDYDCDHVTFHSQLIKEGFSIHMNPSQIVLYNETRYVLSQL